ncbi:MAG TPA: hypothetical protein PK328_15780 [Chitinophagaceae bacterium]|nr:hypothetical protein [Chitinophagaceae bacterium]
MRLILFYLLILLCLPFTNTAQSKLGDVASIYVTTSNLDSSLSFYEKLGFTKKAANEYPVPWVQVSDGSLLVTMRKDNTPYIGLTYYMSDPESLVATLEKDSIVFIQKPKAGDFIQRYLFKTPEGFNIVLSNNPGGFVQPAGPTLLTMKPADYTDPEKYPNKLCGAFGEFAYPVSNLAASLRFWKKLGFAVKSEMKSPYPHAILSDGLMIIGLHQATHFNYPAITYFGIKTADRISQLKKNGLQSFTEMGGKTNVILQTWEGQHFFIFSLGM